MNKNGIKKALQALGLKEGDIVLLHSSLGSIGKVDGGADAVVNAFLEVLGKTGTLVAPVFGDLGILTHVVRNHPQAVISDCPKGTVAAIGASAKKICMNHWKADTVHGAGTPYLKIAGLDGYILLLGVDQDRNTTMHSVEALLQLPYLQPVSGTVKTGKGEFEKTWQYYPGPHRDFIGLDKLLRDSGKMKTGKIGNAAARLIKSQDLIDLLLEAGINDPAFCLCENPECADCVAQRAAIYRADMSKEDFKLASSSSLAGKYVPEMIDNLQAAGIDYVELDFIQGLPAHLLSVDKLRKIIQDFAESNIRISGIRLPGVPAEIKSVSDLAEKCGIDRIILPVCSNASELAATAAAGIAVSFYNSATTGQYAGEIMQQLKKDSINAGFTFSPAGFARCGEKPFLQTYRIGKFRKYIEQLDIEDSTFTGVPAKLARGNAELKELVSILRCSGFSGFMTLSAANRAVGNIAETAAAFRKLLAEI